jgi:tRNA (guanine37-N1)-methyltransferase
MKIDILSLFPDYFRGPFDESIIGQARKSGLVEINLINIRDYADNKHRRVDDRVYGGGPGMVLMPGPVVEAVREAKTKDAKVNEEVRVIYLSPQGKTLTAKRCRELAAYPHLVLLAGHYEGIDERAIESVVDEEISIGDYVLSNGCIAAIVLVDAVLRFVPGVIGHEQSACQDSFETGADGKTMLDCPHYTRPEEFEGKRVPDVLLSGNHEKIAKWRREKALEKTKKVRPDL